MRRPAIIRLLSFILFFGALTSLVRAYQSSSGTVSGTVTDPSGALVSGATVQIGNHVSGYTRTTKTDNSGQFRFYNVPFNPYRINATAPGFAATTKSIDI